MAVNDFVRRSMQIVAGGIAQSTTDYFDNAITFVNDVKEVIDMGKQSASDGVKKFNELKSSSILKKARDWFYNEGGMFGDFDFDDDDFDAGFEIDSADSDKGGESTKPLSKDMMTDIAKKQTGAMYKAFGRQADLHIANTAEIISTINTRTAELTASVNNVNNTLIQIGKRLDLIVEWTAGRAKKEEESKLNASILDYGGGISLSGLVNKSKETLEDSTLGTYVALGKTLFGSGMMTPEMLLSTVLSNTILNKKWKKLDDKSINDIGEFINDTVGEVIQRSLTKVLTSKNDFLETLFEDIIHTSGGKNYRQYVTNQYNDKPAVFDGMTRKSIVTIIPGYLNEILKAVSRDGTGMNIDSKGDLTKKNENEFIKTVASGLFRPGVMDYESINRLDESMELSRKEITNAIRTLVGCWVFELQASGRRILDNDEITNISRASTIRVVRNASRFMASKDAKHRNVGRWFTYFQVIMAEMDEIKVRMEIQKAYKSMDDELKQKAKTTTQGHLYGVINGNVLTQAFEYDYSEYNKGAGIKPTPIGSSSSSTSITSMDYMAAIMTRLNTGVNVWIDKKRGKPYDPIVVKPGMSRPATATIVRADSLASSIEVTESHEKAKRAALDDDTREVLEKLDRGETLTKSEEKIYKKYKKSKSIFSKFKDTLSGGDETYGIVADPEGYEITSKIVDMFSDIFGSKRVKKISNTIKDTDAYQKVANSPGVQNMRNAATNTINTVADKAFGEKTTGDDGVTYRTGGKVQQTIGRANNIITGLTPTPVLKSRAQNVLNDTENVSSHDAEILQTVNMMVQASFADNDYSNIDNQGIVEAVNSIEDKSLQRKLNQSLIPLLKRNGKNLGGGESESKPNSALGKVAKMAFSAFKFALTPIIGYVKVVLFGVFSLVKNVGKAILGFAKWGIMRGLRQIKYGAKSFAQGVKGVFKPITKYISLGVDKITGMFDWMREKMSNTFNNILDKLTGSKKDKTEKETGPAAEKQGIYGTISGAKEKLANKLANGPTGFMKGFTQAYRERKEAEHKASTKEQAEPTKVALESVGVPEIKDKTNVLVELVTGIKDVLTGKEKGITQDVNKKLDEIEKNQDEDKGKPESSGGSTESAGGILSGGKGDKQKKTKTVNVAKVATGGGGNATGGAAGAAAKAVAGGGKGGGILESIGQMLGGMSGMLMGLVNVVLTIVMSLEGFKLMIDTVMNILKESLEPLNVAFQSITKTLKPFIKQLGGIIKQLASFIVEIVEVVCDIIQPIMKDVIQPILEVLSPLLETIITLLTPILSIIGVLVKVILAPFFGVFKFVVVPILKIIGDAVQIIMGLFQVVGGALMMGIGGIISAIGGLISLVGKIPLLGAVGNVGEGILDTGKSMMDSGKDMFVQGGKAIGEGAVNLVLDYASLYTLGLSDKVLRPEEETKETKKIEATDEDVVSRTYANGDLYSTYGGEYQRGMGGYLNMNQRGCGPIALADMYNRNNDSRVSARTLAGSMYGNGAYDPHRGTSVGGYIDTARSLGMNLTPGKVTQQSLKSASPTNPITVVGSGSDYGTRRGNNHFMNVIGTDSHGGAYVSNPLTGRIDRRPASTVAGSAVMGLYGSGDSNAESDGGYSFPQAIKEAFRKLKEEASKILGLFNMDKSDDEEINEAINAEQNKNAMEQAKRQLGDDYATYEKEAMDKARADFETKYPKKDGETDEAHEAKFKEYWNTHSAEYLAETKLMEAASAKSKDGWQALKNTSDSFVDSYVGKVGEDGTISGGLFDKLGDAYSDLNDQTKSLGGPSSSGGSGGGRGDVNDIYEAVAEVWEAMASKAGGSLYSYDNHGPITTRSGVTLPEIHPDCSGMLSAAMNYMGYDFKGTVNGSTKRWTTHDISGKTSNNLIYKNGQLSDDWEFIPYSPDELKEGDILTTPEHVGLYVEGTSSNAKGWDAGNGDRLPILGKGAAKAYLAGDPDWKSQLQWTMGPGYPGLTTILRYVKPYYNGLIGDNDQEMIWAYLTSHGANPTGASGFMGVWEVESANNPSRLEGDYAMGGINSSRVLQAFTSQDEMNKYVEEMVAKVYGGWGTLNRSTYQPDGVNYYPGVGLAQWTGNRTKAVFDKAKQLNIPYNSLEAQLGLWDDEVTNNSYYKSALTGANNAGTPAAAAEKVLNIYEGLSSTNKYAALAKRQEYANQFYQRFKDWDPSTAMKQKTTATGSGSYSTGYGLVNSPGDAAIIKSTTNIKSLDGKNTGRVMTDSGVSLGLRSGKADGSTVLVWIPNGTSLNLEDSGTRGWYKTSYGGKTGYVNANWIVLDNDWRDGMYSSTDYYTGSINSAADARMASIGNEGTTIYTANNTLNGAKVSDKVWAAKDPKWRAAWYNESVPLHVTEFPDAFKDLEKMTIDVARSSSKYYDNLVDAYGGGSLGKDAVKSLYNECGTAEEWKNSRHNYILKSKTKRADVNQIKNMPFVEDLRAIHNAYYPNSKLSWSDMTKRVSGSGDMSELDFWNDYLGWNNAYASSNVTTPIGEDYLTDQSTYYDPETGATVVNNYAVTRGDDTVTRARIKAILANTYNVRSESMEAILEAILEELRKRKEPDNGGTTDTHGSTKLFDERIPAQVRRLSIG